MTTRTHNADWSAEVDLPTQRYELKDVGSYECYNQLVTMDYASSATEGWCDAEDVAKLEDEVKRLTQQCTALLAVLEPLPELLRDSDNILNAAGAVRGGIRTRLTDMATALEAALRGRQS